MQDKHDIRIVRFQNNDMLKDHRKILTQGDNSYLSFSYFNNIEIDAVDEESNDVSLNSAYKKLCKLLEEESEYSSQQCILAFLDLSEQRDITHDKIFDFWSDNSKALFFATMIKISVNSLVVDTIARIKSVFRKSENQYLIYTTFEYDEIILFFKGNSFKEYSDLMMRLNFEKVTGISNHIVDTITVCNFSKKVCHYTKETDYEKFGTHMCLGTSNFEPLNRFIDKIIEKAEDVYSTKKCLLGRNDIALVNTQADLKWLYLLYNEYISQKEFDITTFKLSILTEPPENSELAFDNSSLTTVLLKPEIINELDNKFANLITNYKAFCGKLQMEYDKVFIRILCGIRDLLLGMQQNQLTVDLLICLLPQLENFINYLNIVYDCDIDPENVKSEINRMWELVNKFYLNVVILINSTVHSSRQFIQIPNCSAPAFEMSPKIMAYYGIMIRKMADILNDDKLDCGIILAPKLVEELEVESLALDSTEPTQFISIGISEKMFYDIKRTMAISSHELAHFIGKLSRNRKSRAKSILVYFLVVWLLHLDKEFYRLIRGNQSIDVGETDIDEITKSAGILANLLFESLYDNNNEIDLYLRKTDKLINGALKAFRNNYDFVNKIYELLYKEKANSFCKSTISSSSIFQILEENDKEMLEDSYKNFQKSYAYSFSYNIFLNALELFISHTNQPDFLEEIRYHLNDYVKYIFSEAYADISMIKMFDMNYNDYIMLYFDDSSNTFDSYSKGELIRIFCVVCTLHSMKVWENKDIRKITHLNDNKNADIINDGFKALKESENSFLAFLKENEFDITLMGLVVTYLKKCVGDMTEHLKAKTSELNEIRTLYKDGAEQTSFLTLLEKIRGLEKAWIESK